MPISKFKRMASSLPAFYKAETNTILGGLLKAWGLGDDEIELQIQNAKDQLFVQSAEGRYLDFLGNNVGVPRDPGLGVSDNDFRKLVPVLSFYPKQVRKTIISLLDVFWGPGFTRPNINSGNTEIYDFGPDGLLTGTVSFIKGDNKVVGQGTQFLTELRPGDYIKPTTASGYTYQKVSAIHSNTVLELSQEWEGAIAIGKLCATGTIRTLDYSVDNSDTKTIRFKPSSFADITAVTVDELVKAINVDLEHSKFITASKFLDPLSGNKLNIRSNTPGLRGAIQILGGDANTPSRLNFSLVKQIEVKASVFEVNPNEVVIQIPSSVPVLRRTLKGAVHPKQTKAEIYSNDETFDFSGLGATSTLIVSVDGNPYTVTFTHASDFADASKATSDEIEAVINSQLTFLKAFSHHDGNYKKIGLRTSEGSSEYQVTGGTANAILGFVTDLQTDPDLIKSDYPSAYLFDPVGQLFTVTGISTQLTNTISSGSLTSTITVNNAASFPNKPGKVLFNFGRSQQEGPIAYNSRPNNSTLLIDASHVFQKEHEAGRMVNYISDTPTIPRITGDDYAVYIVGTEGARTAAQNLIKQLLASGVVIRFLISFPEALFECVCRGCGPSDDPTYRGTLTGQSPLVF